MDKKQIDWTDEILHSMKDVERAKPDPSVFQRIEARIEESANVIPIKQWKWVAAASLLIGALNIWGASNIAERTRQDTGSTLYEETILISNYNYQE